MFKIMTILIQGSFLWPKRVHDQELSQLHSSHFQAAAHGSFSDITVLMSGLKNDNYFPDTIEESDGQAHSRRGRRAKHPKVNPSRVC